MNGNKVVGADACASNGVAHVVDGVLLPPKDASSCKFYDVKPSGGGGGGDDKNTTTTEPKMVVSISSTQHGVALSSPLYIHTHTHIDTYIYTSLITRNCNSHMRITHARTHASICTHTHIHIHTHTYTHTCTCNTLSLLDRVDAKVLSSGAARTTRPRRRTPMTSATMKARRLQTPRLRETKRADPKWKRERKFIVWSV